MKLYYHPLSSYAQKVLIALHEKELEYEGELVNLRDPEERQKYLEVYPLGKIPLLMREDGRRIPESSIIIEYLDGISDRGPRLIPRDPEQGRVTRFKDRMMDLYVNETVTTLLFQSWKPESEQDPERIDTAKFRLDVMYGFMDQGLGEHEWMAGDAFTMADCAAAAPLLYAQEVAPFGDRVNIVAYWERLQARPSFQKVLAEAAPYLEELKKSA